MGLRPGPRQQAGREVTPLGDPGGETAKSRARHGSLKGWGAAPERVPSANCVGGFGAGVGAAVEVQVVLECGGRIRQQVVQ